MILVLPILSIVATVGCGGPGFAEESAAGDFTRVEFGAASADRGSTAAAQWMDIDGDGDLDLFVPNGYDVSTTPVPQPDHLYLNDGSGGFAPSDPGLAALAPVFSSGATWGDFDNDGHVDVFIPVQRGEAGRLLRGVGGGAFEPVTDQPPVQDGGLSFGASWVDADGDGLLDLFVSNGGLSGDARNFLYRNVGEAGFERAPPTPITADSAAHRGGSWGDCSGNGLPDLFIPSGWSSRSVTSALYRNDGDWAFTELADAPAATDTMNAFASAWGDYDNDGHMDLIVGTRGVNRLYRNEGDCRLVPVREGGPHLVDGGDTYSIHWVDHDNDGLLDILAVNWGSPSFLYTNLGNGHFERRDHGDLGRLVTFGSGASWGDFDGDGDLDLLLANWPNWPGDDEDNHLYRNDERVGNWLGVRLVGTRSNRSAIGARIRVLTRTGGQDRWQIREIAGSTGFRSQDPLQQHFGLGNAERAEVLEVWWPSGLRERFPTTIANQVVTLTEGEGEGEGEGERAGEGEGEGADDGERAGEGAGEMSG